MTQIALGSHQEKWVRYTLDHAVETGEPTNEVQTLTVAASGGTYDLTCLGHAVTGLAFGLTATALKAALVSGGVATGDVVITGGPGDLTGTTPYTFTFGGAQAGVNVATMVADSTNLTGGAHTATVATQTGGGTGVVLTLLDEHGKATKIPDNAVIVGFYIEPDEDFVSNGSATIKLGVDDSGLTDALFIGATAFNNAAFLAATQALTGDKLNKKVNKSGGTSVIATLAGADLTDGRLHVHVGVRAGV